MTGPPDDVVFRLATGADVGRLTELYLESAAHHLALDADLYQVPDAQAVEARIVLALVGVADSAVLVAERQGVVVGMVEATVSRSTGHWTMLRPEVVAEVGVVVAAAHRGQGVGEGLMRAAEDWARGRGAEAMTLSVHAANERAQRLYRERLGYHVTGLFLRKRLDVDPPAPERAETDPG